ncbi:MAG: efflux RND transporter periplasmic adaptor subunit [Planctomycetales bacterium]|nr:efflux RND transporter periplasmic adaptor subunit [Planctomycetales bacterium]
MLPRANYVLLSLLLVAMCAQHINAQGLSSRIPIPTDFAPDGVLQPWKASDVACLETGLLEELLVKRGERVSQGQPLATLESSIVKIQRDIAAAQAAARGRLDAAEAEVALGERKVAAFREARREQYGSQLELERAEADLRISKARLLAETEEHDLLLLQLARLDRQLEMRTVRAPFDGVVVEILKDVGEAVAALSSEVIRIVDVSRLRASFYLQPAELEGMTPGSAVTVRLGKHGKSTAIVESIAPVADPESGLIEVSVLIDNPGGEVLGSRCTLHIDEPIPSVGLTRIIRDAPRPQVQPQ